MTTCKFQIVWFNWRSCWCACLQCTTKTWLKHERWDLRQSRKTYLSIFHKAALANISAYLYIIPLIEIQVLTEFILWVTLYTGKLVRIVCTCKYYEAYRSEHFHEQIFK